MWARVRSIIGNNRIALITVFGRMISAGGWMLNLLLVAKYLSPEGQGYYYTFQSLIALQAFLEMGATTVIITVGGHEVSRLAWRQSRWCGDLIALERLSSFFRVVLKWFGVVSIAFALVIIPVGSWFFSRRGGSGHEVAWIGPWVALGLATAASLLLVGLNAFAEGIGAIEEVAKIRAFQSGVRVVVFAVALWLGADLWACAWMAVAGTVVNAVGLFWICGARLSKIWKTIPAIGMKWRKTILPFQGRIGLSWMAGYITFQLMTPVIFAFQGAKIAGEFGMALQIALGVSTLATSWVMIRQNPWAQAIARGEWDHLSRDFRRTLVVSSGISAVMAVGIGLVFLGVHLVQIPIRIPRWSFLIPLGTSAILNTAMSAIATYLRSFKREPFLPISILMALSVALGSFLLRGGHPVLLAWWYCVTVGLIGLGGGLWLLRQHQNPLGSVLPQDMSI